LANNSGSFLTFPQFFLPVDDSSDCTVAGKICSTNTTTHFDSSLAGCISAVSDNTRFRKNRRPIIPNNTPKGPTTSTNESNLHLSTDLPMITEMVDTPLSPETSISTLKELSIDSLAQPSSLSPTEIKEIYTIIVSHLQKHGKITLDLINLLKDGPPSSHTPTSSTPKDRPTLLSSDKMPSSTASHHRFTIPQLSRHFGFRSLKNWDILHDVCQPNFSLSHPSERPLELGDVANIKKARSNKTPIERPSNFMEVVHCDIGYGDTKSIGNGASYCIILVNRATRYNWIYPLRSLRHDSIKSALSQWTLDAGQFPSRLYTDFDQKF
jgi:hypothetical protein